LKQPSIGAILNAIYNWLEIWQVRTFKQPPDIAKPVKQAAKRAPVRKLGKPSAPKKSNVRSAPEAAAADSGTFQTGGVASLLRKYVNRSGVVEMDRLADGLGFSKKNLAGTLGMAMDTIYRPERLASPATQTRMREMLEILGRITDWAGGETQAMAWYRAQPIPAFGGRTAEALVKDNQAGPLREYLDHLSMGGFA
jgi:hypothetical protein